MAEISQSINHGDGRSLGPLFDDGVVVRSNHQAVKIARQYAGGIGDRFATAELNVSGGQEERLTPELVHARFERYAGPGRGFLEQEAERRSDQGLLHQPAAAFRFQLGGQAQQPRNPGRRNRADREEVFPQYTIGLA